MRARICAGQAEGAAWRGLQKARTDWAVFPFPNSQPAQGQRLHPCLLNREAWQKVETGLEEQ